MQSLQSRIINFILRNRHLLHFRLKKDVIDWNTSIPRFRQECEKMNSMIAKLPSGIKVSGGLLQNQSQNMLVP
ncbi:MAG: hypothetical protein GY795_46695 [Desulfobacterales bacterium]|nr:hypothetical protein [Desulfobacterales bacterium]